MIRRNSMKLVKFYGYEGVRIDEKPRKLRDPDDGFWLKVQKIPTDLVGEFREDLITMAIREVQGEDAEKFSGIDFRDNKATFIMDDGQGCFWAFNFYDGWMYYIRWNMNLWCNTYRRLPENLQFGNYTADALEKSALNCNLWSYFKDLSSKDKT